jgi:hypothetical protein
MRIISHLGLLVFISITGAHVLIATLGLERLWTFVILQSATMACIGLTASNFGAMAMEPVGSVAGIGASLQGFISTFGGAVVGALIGRRIQWRDLAAGQRRVRCAACRACCSCCWRSSGACSGRIMPVRGRTRRGSVSAA